MEMELFELEEFEGTRPGGTRLKLSGLAHQNTGPLHKGDELILLVRATVDNVSFPDDAKRGMLRVHSASIKEAYQVPDGAQHTAAEWLQDHRVAHKVAQDRLVGQTSIDDPTPEELAEEERRLAEAEAAEGLNADERATRDDKSDDGWEDPEGPEKPDDGESDAVKRARELAEKEGPAVTAPRAARRAKQPS